LTKNSPGQNSTSHCKLQLTRASAKELSSVNKATQADKKGLGQLQQEGVQRITTGFGIKQQEKKLRQSQKRN